MNTDQFDLLSGYLHDANLYNDDITFDREAGILWLKIRRICIEGSKRKRILFVIPVVRYPVVESLLSLKPVISVDFDYCHLQAEDPKYSHTILYFERDGATFIVRTDGVVLRIKMGADAIIELKDVALPSRKHGATDYFRSVHDPNILIELNKFRIDV